MKEATKKKPVMKNIIYAIAMMCLALFYATNMEAQITLDNIVTPTLGIGYDFYTVQISSTETKYLFNDTTANTFSLFNMDFTPFLTNIGVPEPFDALSSQFQVIYVTRALFDCDTSNIEYVYQASSNSNKPFRIMRTDGTQLFQLDSAFGPYCLGGCLNMSDIIIPIRNTSSGTKLFLNKYNPSQQIFIYSLCGTLPNEIFDFATFNQSLIKIYPNPASNSLTFEFNLPDNINEYEIVILDNSAKEVIREKINIRKDRHIIDLSDFRSGTYYYSLCTKSKAYQSGKFIINK